MIQLEAIGLRDVSIAAKTRCGIFTIFLARNNLTINRLYPGKDGDDWERPHRWGVAADGPPTDSGIFPVDNVK